MASDKDLRKRKKYDWATIESEYRTGTYSDAELARRHGCSRAAIQKWVKKEGWTRDLSVAVSKSFRAKLIQADAEAAGRVAGGVAERVAEKVASGSLDTTATDEESIDRAAETRFQVVASHRRDIAELRKLEIELISELRNNPTKLYITQYQGKIIQAELGLTVAERAQAANNLANVQHKRIALERQAFNLDAQLGSEGNPFHIAKHSMDLSALHKAITGDK